MSALLLHDLLIVQLSMVNGATVNVTSPSVNPARKFDPDVIDVWINGLWVVSLVTSLVVALSAVLVKQWLHRYMTFPSGTPGLRSHIRQFRFMGLEKWRVRIIIGMLPIIMHISLMLFLAGFALFYVQLRASLAWAVGTITVLVCVLYLVSNTIPIIFPQCPYQTPLTDFIHHVCQVVSFSIQSIRHYCFVAYRDIRKWAGPSRQQSTSFFATALNLHATASDVLQSNLKSLTQLESAAVRDAHDTLSVDALDWLYQTSSNPTVQTLVFQGISGLPPESQSYAVTRWRGATDMQTRHHQLIWEALPSLDFPDQPWVMERLCRSSLFLPIGPMSDSLRQMLREKFDDCDPRITAAISIAYGWPIHHYTGFFISLLMHPLIWDEIIHLMFDHFSSPHWDTTIDGSSLFRILSLVISPLPPSPSASLETGPQVFWRRSGSQLWDTILKTPILAPHNSVPGASISSYHRTLLAAGKLAIFNARQCPYDKDLEKTQCQRLELIVHVVRLIVSQLNADYWKVDLDFFISVLKEF